MSLDETKALALRFFEAFNTGDMATIAEMAREDYVQHSPGVPADRAALIRFVDMFLKAFPDGRFHLEDMIAEGDKVLLRWTCQGTQRGTWMGSAPTGRQVRFVGMDLWRFENGQIVEAWFIADNLSLLQQLGMVAFTSQEPHPQPS